MDQTTVTNRKNRRNRNQPRRDPWSAPRQICRAPRLDNQQLMELHKNDGAQNYRARNNSRKNDGSSHPRKSEFLDLWLDQLEETTRQMPHEALLQRVLELENELLQTQEKLKKATKDLRSNQGGNSSSRNFSAPSSPFGGSPLYCVSPRNQGFENNSPLYCSPIYQSPRLISPSAE